MWSRESPRVRPPAVAGSWYPGDAAALQELIETMLADVPGAAPSGLVRALVVPHAGIVYSGRTAAHGYTRLRGGDYGRVVVMGPSHRAPLRGAAIDPSSHYHTPLGLMAVDSDAVNAIAASERFVSDPRPFQLEHAIEMQVPFLQVVLPEAKLVPILVGEPRDEEEFAALAACI